jgi:hypothetical protein
MVFAPTGLAHFRRVMDQDRRGPGIQAGLSNAQQQRTHLVDIPGLQPRVARQEAQIQRVDTASVIGGGGSEVAGSITDTTPTSFICFTQVI